MRTIWLCVFPVGEVQVYLWVFRCRNIVLVTPRFFVVANLTILIPLSLLSWSSQSFPIVCLKILSLPTFALKSPKRIFMWYLGKWSKTCTNFF
jgi:predicted benzoate:H+ symporter BenE